MSPGLPRLHLGGWNGPLAIQPHGSATQSPADASSTRFIVFDEHAKIITEHQTEFDQILPHAGWHEHNPEALVDAMNECMSRAMYKLEFMGWHKESVRGIGITNQRETTVCWSRSSGKSLCNAIVWDDTRTVAVVRQFEDKLDDEGFVLDDGTRVKGKDALVKLTGLPLSTYFSAIKLRWMLGHHKAVREADEAGDLMFGTVDSWLVYVSDTLVWLTPEPDGWHGRRPAHH